MDAPGIPPAGRPRNELVGLGVILAVAVAVCSPWLLDAAPDFAQRDAAFSTVAFHHVQGALIGVGGWAGAPLAWPFPDGTTRADWMAGQAALLLPAHLLGVDPSRMYELASFLGMLLTAWCGYLLARLLVGKRAPAVLAGLVAGLGPLQLGHAAHANLVHHEVALLPAILLFLGFTRRRPWVAGLGGLAAGLAWHFGLYMGLHAALVTGVAVLGLAVARQGPARAWVAAAAGLGAAIVTLVPVARLYAHAATDGGVPEEEGLTSSWDLGHTFALSAGSPLHAFIGSLSPVRLVTAMESPNPGFVVSVLAFVGLVTGGRPRGPWLVVLGAGGVAAALALGDTPLFFGHAAPFPGPHALLDAVTGGNLRAPVRWLALTHVAVALYASAGLAYLVGRLSRSAGVALTVAVLAVAIAELTPRPGGGSAPLSAVYCALDAVEEEGALFEALGKRCGCDGTTRLRATLFHGRPVVGGNYARYTPALSAVNRLLNGWPNPGVVTFLRATRSRVVLEHPPLRGPAPADATCDLVDGHRLCVLADRPPIPAPSAVTTTPNGPAIGLRWPSAPSARAVTVTCGATSETHPVDAWQVLATVRGVATFDVFPEAPCATGWASADGAAVALYGDPARAADTWLPELPPRGPGMAGAMGGACRD